MIEYHANENDTFGVFVFAGYQPNTSLVKDIVELNESGYIVTDQNQKQIKKVSMELVMFVLKNCVKSLQR